ncbi:hypothetical protein [Lactococcus lactis]|uniref:hypothetical protein n=1 Tax=Lactococcus lactis TaxID=1358 RepID=UPI00223BA8B8|nr:hypothetical protein [Lactococcus lactis]MCT0449945.1 hypothetical protein [Lactococcus lactis subsp. lactis]
MTVTDVQLNHSLGIMSILFWIFIFLITINAVGIIFVSVDQLKMRKAIQKLEREFSSIKEQDTE